MLTCSILNSMDKPPTVGDKQKKLLQKQRDEHQKREAEEKEKLRKFRDQVEDKINKFIQDPEKQKYKFAPMAKVHRTIIHDVADIAGLTAFSFGEEEVDRYVMIFKKEFAPSDDELAAYRKGEEWDPEKAKAAARQRELAAAALAEQAKQSSQESAPQTDYHEKYEKLLGRESGKDAAKITTPNKQFGFVPSQNKKDVRTIEQALADIRAKKKQKTDGPSSEKSEQDWHFVDKNKIMHACKSRLEKFERPCSHHTADLSWHTTCPSRGSVSHLSLLQRGGLLSLLITFSFLAGIKVSCMLFVVQSPSSREKMLWKCSRLH